MFWWMAYVLLRICLSARNTNPLNIPRIKRSLFNNTGVSGGCRNSWASWERGLSLWGLSLCNNVPLSGPGVSAPTWFGNAQNLGVSWHQHQLCMTLHVQILWLGMLQTLNLYSWEQNSDWFSTVHGLVCLCLFLISGSISSSQERGDGRLIQNNQGFPLY